jgi:dTDP-4-dehydrorhamnose reductase
MKALITGGAGMLGTSLEATLKRMGCDCTTSDIREDSPPGVQYVDVRDKDGISKIIRETKPEVVYHLAAETDLEHCENFPDEAYRTNVVGTQNVVLAARESDAVVVYVSTAGVFDGTKPTPYTEFDQPHPINVYGSSKYQGELIVQGLTARYFIVRAGWMIGGGPKKDHKFVSKIVNQIREGRKEIACVTDKTGTPTYAPFFSDALYNLVLSGDFGVYHLVCKGVTTRLGVAKEILEILRRDDIILRPVDSSYFAKEFPTPRPPSEALTNYMLRLKGLDTIRTWQEGLRDYLKAYDWDVEPKLSVRTSN